MPELPDVEAVIKRIRRKILNRRIRGIAVLDKTLISKSRLKSVQGKKIAGITRRGKYILFLLDGDCTLVIHLRMTGTLLVTRAKAGIDAHTRFIIRLDADRELRFIDQRRLSMLYVIRDMDFRCIPGLRQMGPEPLSADFTPQAFNTQLQKRTGRIKSLLMNQRFIAGIGNIYGDEILFQSRIRPSRKACDLTSSQVQRLYNKIRYVLEKSCEHNADLSEMHKWFVQGRGEGYCVNCKGELKKIKIQGRYSYFCARCQR